MESSESPFWGEIQVSQICEKVGPRFCAEPDKIKNIYIYAIYIYICLPIKDDKHIVPILGCSTPVAVENQGG